jgi:Icc-related predicted phosphoesterase
MRKLKICHFSDTHGKHKYVKIPECDVLICSGDISMLGQKNELESFFRWFKLQSNCTHKILIAGNHDLTFDPQRGGNNGTKPGWLISLIEQAKKYNIIYLENESCEIEGVKFWGSPTSAWFHGDYWCFNVNPEDSERIYSTIPLGTDVVITHGPAFSYKDWCRDVDRSVGDKVLDNHLQRVKPLLHLFGHIHESYGAEKGHQGTYYFNGSVCDLSYIVNNKPWLIEADFDNKEVEVLNGAQVL